jgi:hypothetical protein
MSMAKVKAKAKKSIKRLAKGGFRVRKTLYGIEKEFILITGGSFVLVVLVVILFYS